MVEDFLWSDETSHDEGDFDLGDEIRINDDDANSNTSEDIKKYWELTTQNKPFHRTGQSSYSKQSVCRTITVQDDDDGGGDYEHKLLKSNLLLLIKLKEENDKKTKKSLQEMYMYGDHLYGLGRLNILEHAVLEMDQLLTVVCQKFPLPLAQCWVTPHPHTEPLRVMYQQSHTGEISERAPACHNIAEPIHLEQEAPGMAPAMTAAANTLRISPPGAAAQQPPPAAAAAAQYEDRRKYEGVRQMPWGKWEAEIREPHKAARVWSQLLQADNVRDYLECSQLLLSTGDDIQLHQHANSLLNPLPHTQTSVDDSRAESSIKCIQPQSLTSKSKRSKENLINEGNTEEIDHSALETTLEVAIKHKEHIVAADTVDELVEEPPIVDIGHNMDVRYTTNTASQISNFEPMLSPPQQVEEETMLLLDTSAQNSRNILVTEKDDTCQEVHTLKREIKPPEDISFESLRQHFGRRLDDAAATFGVSRSTFKRICRVHGINRWPNGKRTMSDNISLNLKRKLNDEEPSRRNFSRSGMPASQDTVVGHTSQHLNKMTVKATYNGITIRFELPDLSGIAELEDNVIERLHLERRSFSIKYQDDEDDWILIACDKDVQECMQISRSLKKTTIKMSIVPPINNHHAP